MGTELNLILNMPTISVRNDHAISESIGLILCGLLFKR